ncbi:importin-alpha export receptor, partial [Coemansia erecta]
ALPLLAAHLAHPDPVVATYAAIAVERLLVLKRDGILVFAPAEVEPLAQPMLGHIFGVFDRADSPQRLAENEYLMKAVMRIVLAARTNILPLAPAALAKLAGILAEVARNPSNPRFNHFMFEAVAALARFSCAADGNAIGQFEATLFPIFQSILQEDVLEFMPYLFQILAQLLSVHQGSGGLPDAYTGLLPPLLQPTLWASQGNIPALVRLLQSYLQIGGAQLAAGGQLQPILGVFQRLIASRANDHHGFALLLAITQFTPFDALKPYLKPIITLCLTRLQSSRTAKFTRNFVHYLASLMCLGAHDGTGVSMLFDAMDGIQPGILATLLGNVLVEAMPTVIGLLERKAVIVGFSLMLVSARFQSDPAFVPLTAPVLKKLAAMLMDTTVTETKSVAEKPLVDGSAASAVATDEDLDSLEIETSGYQASYAKLATLGEIKIDPCPRFVDAASAMTQILRPARAQLAAAIQQLPSQEQQLITAALSS